MKQKLLSFLIVTFCLIGQSIAQDRQVTGRVISGNDRAPLSGVTVRVSVSNLATQTDANGNFSISAPSANASLIFSLVGYRELTQRLGSGNVVNVSLEEVATDLDDVIVVAYGTVKKSDFTGSATQIGAKELDKRPLTNALSALQGAGPGIQTSAPSGAPGSNPTIRLRGVGSYSAGSEPLYVVDGVPFAGGMSNINPDDIENITVLKDAATIAMYGSRGANGVIMVTTRRAKAGEPQLNAKAQFGFNKNAVPNYNTATPGDYYELMWQAYTNNLNISSKLPIDIARQIGSGLLDRNSKGLQVYDGKTYQDIVQYLGGYNFFTVPNDQLIDANGKLNPAANQMRYKDYRNWEDEATRGGKRTEFGLNYSNANEKSDMYTSMNYTKDEGWAIRSALERFQGRINVNSQVTPWMKTGLNLSGSVNNYKNAYTGAGSINNPFYFSRGIAPIYPVFLHDPATGERVYDAQGNSRYDYGNHVAEFGISRPFNSGRHAIAETLKNLSQNDRGFVSARAYIDFQLLPWLTFSTTFSPDFTYNKLEGYENTEVGDGAPGGRYNQEWQKAFNYTFNQLLRANNTFGAHSLETMLGHEYYSYKYESIYGMRVGEGLKDFYTFSNFTDISSLTSGVTEEAVEGYFGRINYNYDSRYYLSAMLRRDGHSRFPTDLRWANFWSVGGAWRLDQENFFRNEHTDLFKLRASYGKLGNSDLSSYYPYQAGYSIGYNNSSAAGMVFTSLGSNTLTWESQKPFDVGVDFSFLKGRLSGTFEYYSRNSDGLLFDVPQPMHNGGTNADGRTSFIVAQNVGAMTNKGIELSLTGGLIRKPDFNWDLTFNLTTIKNKITKMPEQTPAIVSSPFKREAGYSIYEYFTRTYYGVDPETGYAMYLGLKDDVEYSANDHKIIEHSDGRRDTVTFSHNDARESYIGKSALPPVYGSLVNQFSYKNFDFGFVITYSMGAYAYDGQYAGLMSSGPSNGANLHKDLQGAWKNPGDISDIPAMNVGRTAQNGAASTRWLTKSDYLNLSSLTMSYRLPSKWLASAGIRNARVFAAGENLFYLSKRKGFNPVGSLTGATANNVYTHARTFNFGFNIGF